MDPSRRFRCESMSCCCARLKCQEKPDPTGLVDSRPGYLLPHKELDFKTYDGASTSDGHRLPTSSIKAERSRPGPARSVTGTKREFSAATQALLTPSSGFSSARITIETVAPGASASPRLRASFYRLSPKLRRAHRQRPHPGGLRNCSSAVVYTRIRLV